MAADELDERDLGTEIKGNDQSERIVSDLEANALGIQNLRVRKSFLHIIRRLPIRDLARHHRFHAQRRASFRPTPFDLYQGGGEIRRADTLCRWNR